MDIRKTMHTWQSAVEITSLLLLLNLSGIIVIFFLLHWNLLHLFNPRLSKPEEIRVVK